MERKSIIILIITLLISTAALSTAVNINNNENRITRGWSEKIKLLASDGGADDRFGISVGIDSLDAIVGAYYDDISGSSNAGSAYVFIYNGGTWVQQAKLTASDYATDDYFGFSVSIFGDYAIVGAPYDDDLGLSSGSAYIFIRTGTSWAEQAKIKASDGSAGDEFGRSVDIDGDYVIVGAPGKSSNQGFSYIFVRSGTSWSQQAKLGATGSKRFGYSVSISGDTVVMGAYGTNSDTGAAHIYQLVGTSWNLKAKLIASDGAIADLFGISVSVSGDYVLVGAPGHDLGVGGEGAAYIFEKPITGWIDATETVELTAPDASSSDNFGMHVSIDDYFSIITSPDDDDNGIASGSAYIFKKTITGWIEDTKLLTSDGASQDYFGWSVSIKDNNVLVGAYAEDNINGNEAGSAYIFENVNQPPNAPVIDGPLSGKVKVLLEYNITAVDPDNDDVYVYWDWGDGTNNGWIGPVPSGTELKVQHSWSKPKTYTIAVKAKDIFNVEGNTSTLSVTIPRIRAAHNLLLLQLLEHFSTLIPVIKNY